MKQQYDGWILSREEYEILKLISEGYPIKPNDQYGDGKYIVVENPDYQPDNGSDPYRVLSLIDKEDY